MLAIMLKDARVTILIKHGYKTVLLSMLHSFKINCTLKYLFLQNKKYKSSLLIDKNISRITKGHKVQNLLDSNSIYIIVLNLINVESQ